MATPTTSELRCAAAAPHQIQAWGHFLQGPSAPTQSRLPCLDSWFTLGVGKGFPEQFLHQASSSLGTETRFTWVPMPGTGLAPEQGLRLGQGEQIPELLIPKPQHVSLSPLAGMFSSVLLRGEGFLSEPWWDCTSELPPPHSHSSRHLAPTNADL